MKLVGVGVGPGDPELLTLAGLRVLRTADVVFVPVIAANEPGRAEAVVRAHLPDSTPRRLVFALSDPVDGPQQRRRRHWDEAAEQVAGHLRAHGGTVAFATLGDPAVYSTFGHLAATVRGSLPEVVVETVPGITAMQAAASAAGLALAEGSETLTLLPLTRGTEGLSDVLGRRGTVVLYKGGRRLGEVREVIDAAGRLDDAVYAEHLGTPDAVVGRLSEVDVDSGPYLSTVIVPPSRGELGAQW